MQRFLVLSPQYIFMHALWQPHTYTLKYYTAIRPSGIGETMPTYANAKAGAVCLLSAKLLIREIYEYTNHTRPALL